MQLIIEIAGDGGDSEADTDATGHVEHTPTLQRSSDNVHMHDAMMSPISFWCHGTSQ